MTAHSDILTTLAPPIRLVIWLDKVFDAKRKKGELIPPEFERWMDLWATIRWERPAITDTLTPEEWTALEEVVERAGKYVTGQPALLTAPEPQKAY